MNSGASATSRVVWMIRLHCFWDRWPERSRENGTPASEQRMRRPSSWALISSEKIPTGRLSRSDTCWQQLRAKLVLPMPGRPAMITRFPRLRPWVIRSRSTKPVGMPMSVEPGRSSRSSRVSWRTEPSWTKPLRTASSPRLKTACSARPSASAASRPPSRQSRRICWEAEIRRRRIERSLMIST